MIYSNERKETVNETFRNSAESHMSEASAVFLDLLERVFKQRLSGHGDLHVAGESIGLRIQRYAFGKEIHTGIHAC